MPHLRIRALNETAVKALSISLPPALAKVLNTSEDNFTVEKVATTYFKNGAAVAEDQLDPMVEFLWFDRGDEARDLAAKKVTEQVKQHSKSEYIAVVFVSIPKDHYYENAVSFG